MSVVLARVDNRLIHGQVLEAWVPHTRADYIIVVDDEVANDPFRKLLMSSVVPKTLQVDIYSHAQLKSIMSGDKMDNARVLVLFATPANALRAYQDGLLFSVLNLGNMHVGSQKCCISRTLYMDNADIEDLEQLSRLGVDISAQCIPTDRALQWDCNCSELGS
ncbi:MAG: PTS sugar transporter subunit IIB [Thermodesulfobacteriota bacterium]|nr:PTS sugar transporter subunit IIB [Thermodesulfobacteriota bacterium]